MTWRRVRQVRRVDFGVLPQGAFPISSLTYQIVLYYQLRVTNVTDYRDELCCVPYQGYAEYVDLANGAADDRQEKGG